MKKILVTGASGFVGSHLVEAAKSKGLIVHAAVRATSNIADIQSHVDQFVYPDFGNEEALKTLFEKEKYNYIVHAAALTKAKSERDMWDINVRYTENILSAAFSADMPLQRIVYVSSLAAIGPTTYNAEKLINEEFPYQPLTIYGRSKQTSEMLIREKFGDKAISVFRPTAVYGPRERDIFIVFDTMFKGLDPYIGNRPQKLSFIYVRDLVDVLLRGCVQAQDGLQFYNVTDGQVYSRYKMAEIVREVFDKKMLRLHVPYRVVKVIADMVAFLYRKSSKTPVIYPERLKELTAENWGCDVSKMKRMLGFEPRYDLDKGLRETLLWYKENNWL
ncbi:MAG TPA: NAD-dependent epimerase/dehydratase family protein [Sphingobacterium sp.]|nr:NAD-dependent epimerase/dehydratase family protein [Sphingobacterium sp.]